MTYMLQAQRSFPPQTSLQGLLKPTASIDWSGIFPRDRTIKPSAGIAAHRRYYENDVWTKGYFDYVHRCAAFRERWTAALGDVADKTVIEIGCGPGNVFSALGLRPETLIGVDVAPGALAYARAVGYEVLTADAHDLPFASAVADIVVINATIHHCDDMAGVIAEAARLVAPGGLLVSDHDPQLSAWRFRGVGLFLWYARLPIYRWLKIGYHSTIEEQNAVLESELHHGPGEGVTKELFENTLRPLGFDVEVYPHNHRLGREVFERRVGPSELKYQIAQALSGVNPFSEAAALSLMCIARRSRDLDATSGSHARRPAAGEPNRIRLKQVLVPA